MAGAESYEVCWPYDIKSISINPVKNTVQIISESKPLVEEVKLEEVGNEQTTLIFELSLNLLTEK